MARNTRRGFPSQPCVHHPPVCRIVLSITGATTRYAAPQVASKIGARQAVDEKVDAVVAEKDGSRDADPAKGSVRLGRVDLQLEQLTLADDGCALLELDVVGTPGDEERNVQDNERGGDRSQLP